MGGFVSLTSSEKSKHPSVSERDEASNRVESVVWIQRIREPSQAKPFFFHTDQSERTACNITSAAW